MSERISPTPILDGTHPLPRKRAGSLASSLRSGLFFVWIFGAFWLLLEVDPNLPELPPLPLWLALYVVAAYASVVVHEAGHAVLALSTGLRLISIRVWPCTFVFENGRFVFDWKGRMGLTRVKTDNESAYLKARIPFLIGGVIGNAVATGIAVGFLFAQHGALAAAHPIASAFFIALMMVSSYYVIANLLPVVTAKSTSDGAQLVDALRGSPKRARDIALGRLEVALAAGKVPGEFDESDLACALAVSDGTVSELRARLLMYAHLIDRDDSGPVTAAHLERALELCAIAPDFARGSCAVSAAIFLGWYRGDADGARGWLARLRALPNAGAPNELSADILTRWMDGDRDGALKACDAAIAALADAEGSARAPAYLREMQKWRENIASRAPLSEPA